MITANTIGEDVVEATYAYAAKRMVGGGFAFEVEAELIEKGVDRDSAEVVVSDLDRLLAKEGRGAATKSMVQGVLWCIGGIGGIALTFRASALAGAGAYVLGWCAILFGAIQLLRGLVQTSHDR